MVLGCDTPSMGNRIQTCRGFSAQNILEAFEGDDSTLPRNVEIRLFTDATSQSREEKSLPQGFHTVHNSPSRVPIRCQLNTFYSHIS